MKLDEQQRILDELWNYDMDQVPMSYIKTVETIKNGKTYKVDKIVRKDVFLLLADGFSTLSNWLPEQQRWNMLGKTQEPIAFIPVPRRPAVIPQVAT